MRVPPKHLVLWGPVLASLPKPRASSPGPAQAAGGGPGRDAASQAHSPGPGRHRAPDPRKQRWFGLLAGGRKLRLKNKHHGLAHRGGSRLPPPVGFWGAEGAVGEHASAHRRCG